jgi:hypothetical protein
MTGEKTGGSGPGFDVRTIILLPQEICVSVPVPVPGSSVRFLFISIRLWFIIGSKLGASSFRLSGKKGKMRILFDTNILIYREDHRVIPYDIQKLQRILSALKAQVLVHPGSTDDVSRDTDKGRSSVIASKIKSYPVLENAPDFRNDSQFLAITGQPQRVNDTTDLGMLYAVWRDAVDYLITEDRGIHTKAQRLDIEARVMSTIDALKSFEEELPKEMVSTPPALRTEYVYNLSLDDPIFASLKSEYPEFKTWFAKISKEGRKCWVYYMKNGHIGAILIYKLEDGPIESTTPNIPAKKRLKICTMKVNYTGYKFGELFIKLSIVSRAMVYPHYKAMRAKVIPQ